jgi:hypothetical protein
MIFIYGTHLYGKVDACNGAYRATRFVHLWYLPIFPVGSILVLGGAEPEVAQVATPFDTRSIFVGYMRPWSVVGGLASLVAFLSALRTVVQTGLYEDALRAAFWAIVLFACFALSIVAYAGIGKLGHEEQERRRVYARATGYAVDPADLGDLLDVVRERLLGAVLARTQGLGASGFRVAPDPATQWPEIALDPTMQDPMLLDAAFALSRVEWARAIGEERQRMTEVNRAIWARIRSATQVHAQEQTAQVGA